MPSKSRPSPRAARPSRAFVRVAAVEGLEPRQHLSASPKILKGSPIAAAAAATPVVTPIARPHYNKNRTTTRKNSAGTVVPYFAGSSTPFGKTPTQVRSAYGLGAYGSSPITFAGLQGDGTGQTIAIVDAYDFPTAFTDLNAFSTTFGLPTLTSNTTSLASINSSGGPTFTKISQTGSLTSLPGTDPNGPYSTTQSSTWEQEAALDIEWAHVMAPKANIVLVEGTNSSSLYTAVNYARNIPGVVDVSMSFGNGEFSNESSYDSFYFVTPTGHQGGAAAAGGPLINGGVTFLASTGDSGAYTTFGSSTIGLEYPAASPNVVAVGGTSLTTNGNSYVSESGWGAGTSSNSSGGGGGGISAYEGIPAYQSGTNSAYSTTRRTTPDLSILADPSTGVPIYDSWDYGTSTPWIPGYEGGTSLACPMMAGIVAVMDQGRAVNGIGSLYGNQAGSGNAAGLLQNIYATSASDFHDITSGSNGPSPTYAAVAGYDLVTGRGSPIAGTFIKDVGSTAVIYTASGTAFIDNNGDGSIDGSDTGQGGVVVYADVNNNGVYDSGTDLATTSLASGTFTLGGVTAGTAVREVVPAGYVSTTSATLGTVSGANLTNLVAANFPTTFTAASAATWTLRLDATGTNEQIFTTANGAVGLPSYQIAKSKLSTLSFNGSAANDTFVLDLTNGNPLLASSGVTFNGNGQTSADVLKVQGADGGSNTTFTATSAVVGGLTLLGSNLEGFAYAGGTGNDTVTITTLVGMATAPLVAFTGGGGADTLDVVGGTFAPTADLGADGTNVTLALTNLGAAATFTTSQRLAALNLVSSGAAFNNPAAVLRTGGLAIDSSSALDLNTSGLIYDYTTSTPSAVVRALLATGYAAGAWNGLGLRSAAAAADTTKKHALGYGEASTDLGLTGSATGTFLGQTVDATTLLVRYTAYGDANLDGSVGIVDFNALAVSFGQTANQGWAQGDFTYDGSVNINDFNLLAVEFGTSA